MRSKFKNWWLLIPLLTTLNQTCIKLLAMHAGDAELSVDWVLKALHSPLCIAILLCEITSFVLWLKIIADVPVSKAVPLTAIAYVAILLVSWFAFHEQIFLLQLAGGGLILTGVWLISTASPSNQGRL